MSNNSKHIDEIGYRGAALAHGANYNAQKDYEQNQNKNAKIKMGKSENITLPALSKAINDNFPSLILEFVEHNDETNRSYPVDMTFIEVKYLNNERVVLKGKLKVSLKEFGVGTIEYQFNTQKFYRVSYSDKTTRSRKIHSLIPHNKKDLNQLLSFISKYMYSQEDYQHNIDINGSKSSKAHESMTCIEKLLCLQTKIPSSR